MQGILGTSKNDPFFYVMENGDSLDIYYGFNHFATIPNDKRSPIFKSMISIFMHVGIKFSHIKKNFKISFPTAQKYKDAFTSEEVKLRNPGREAYKATDEVSSFIIERAFYYESEGYKYYHKKIIVDINKKFGYKVSRDTIRLCLLKYRKVTKENSSESNDIKPEVCEKGNLVHEVVNNDFSNCEVIPNSNEVFRNQYAGLLILSPYLEIILKEFTEDIKPSIGYSLRGVATWWMLAIFSGAVNFEQQRYFVIKDFEFISGYINLPSVETMRKILHTLSLPEEVEMTTVLLRKNIEYFIEESSVCYIDSHFIEYSGKRKILSGWNTLKNRANKGTLSHFVHDGVGNPVFAMEMDNFYDYRETIIMLMKKLSDKFPTEQLTLVYDRGGFSIDIMKTIDSDNNIFITWQKGFKQEESIGLIFEKEIEIEYHYNELNNIIYKKYKYTEDIWSSKGYSCRRIIFERETDGKKKFYQAILTNDEKTEAGLIIKTMLKRTWQENDFKKLKNHFGLDEITSYLYTEYNTFNDKDPEKQVKNKKYQAMLSTIRELKNEKKKLLQKLGLKALTQNHLNNEFYEENKKVIDEILALDKIIADKEEEKKQIPEMISRLEQILDEEKVELNLYMKRLFTTVKIVCRNIMEKGAKKFVVIYKNLRDYQKVFRKLVTSAGEIQIEGDTMRIKLDSFGREKFKEKINKFLDLLNKSDLISICGKYKLYFEPFA